MQLKAIWTVLLDRFDFHLDSEFPAPNYGSWVTGPKGAVPTPVPPAPEQRDFFSRTAASTRSYDVAIVGAGPVGSLCALAHARKPAPG